MRCWSRESGCCVVFVDFVVVVGVVVVGRGS